jgi:Fur family transcriptional regulator, ferric uptake regulator
MASSSASTHSHAPSASESAALAHTAQGADTLSPNGAALALARRLVKESGGRNTEARRNVLACLIAAGRALSHAEIETQLANTDLDRVTLYRVLEWLVEQSLAHRVGALAGFDRAMRFAFSRPERNSAHAHFQCVQCGTTMCLDEVIVPALAVPGGIELQGIELAAFGHCAVCSAANRMAIAEKNGSSLTLSNSE